MEEQGFHSETSWGGEVYREQICSLEVKGLLFLDGLTFPFVGYDWVTGLVNGLFCSGGLGDWVNLSPG